MDTTLSLIILGEFAEELPPVAARLSLLNIEPQRASRLDQLPPIQTSCEVLLAELRWLNRLSPTQMKDLSQRAALGAGWIALVDHDSSFQDQVTWLRAGVSHFFHKPLHADRLAALLEDIHDRLDGPPARVIMVDDEEFSLSYYSMVLKDAGIEVMALQDPLLVLEAMENFKPDLLLLDIDMPGCRGTELATIVRQHPDYARMPAIFLTAMEGMQDKLLARAAAAEDYLNKPVAHDLLIAAVKSHILRYRSMQRADAWRRQQEKRARSRLEQLSAAIDQHAVVSIADVNGNIVHVNDMFCTVSGRTRQELIGQNHRISKSGVHSEEFYRNLWQTIGAGRTWHGETCNRNKNGGLYWVEATIVPFLDDRGNPYQYIAIRTDITALKQSQEAMRISEERLRRAQTYANIGTWDWNIQTREIYWSERIPVLFGYPKGDLETSFDNFIAAVHPGDRQAVLDAINASVERDAPYQLEHRVAWPDGTVRWLMEKGAVVRDATGKPLQMLGLVMDIDDRKRAEQISVAAREEAVQANQAKSEFLSRMSHELRTPLNAILGFGQLMEYDATLPDMQKDNLHEILKGGRHLLELINEVLDLAKIESGRIDLSMEPVELADLIEYCRKLIQPLAAVRHISIHMELQPTMTVRADRVRLKQVLLNLLSNAVKYNRDDGRIHLSVSASGHERLRIAVADTGGGIPPERLPELFQPFSRLDAEHSTIEGTGIGLTITRLLVELMGGEVGVDSQVGIGSTFWIELPAETPTTLVQTDSKITAAPATAAGRPRHHVLCIDDNPVNLKLVAQLLGMRRHIHLMTAHSSMLGLELARAHRPDLILLDINLPGMDGFEALRRLREHPDTQHIPVVAISANAMDHDIQRGKAAGFDEYLIKPIDVGQLLTTMDRFLNGDDQVHS